MSYSFDDNEGKADVRKSSNTTKYNGGLDGKADKWTKKRPTSSFNAGQGNRATRNQGLGKQGAINAEAETIADTTKMTPDEKMRYIKSLGLLPK